MSEQSSLDRQDKGVINFEKGYITLPYKQEQFKDFISSVLGQQDTLQGILLREFAIELKDITDIYYLLEERVGQQNQGFLTSFSARFAYQEYSAEKISSFQGLLNYRETRNLIPISVELEWIYLIQFRDKGAPEKQKVTLKITADSNEISRVYFDKRGGEFQWGIEHTERTWALDIDSHLRRHIEDMILLTATSKKRSKWISYVLTKHDETAAICGVMFFLLSVFFASLINSQFIKRKSESAISSILKATDPNMKVEALAQQLLSGDVSNFYLSLVVFLTVSVVFSVIATGIFNVILKSASERKSFILTTKAARKSYESWCQKENRIVTSFIFSIVLTLILNVLSSYIFNILTV